jgi:Cache domain/HAMP domain
MKLLKYFKQYRRTPSLKTSIIGAIFALVGTTTTIVYLPWSITSKRNIDTIVAQVNKEIVLGTSEEVEQLFRSAQSAQQLLQSSIAQKLINFSNLRDREFFLLSILKANPNFTWVQFGDANGDFLGAQRSADGLLKFHFRDWNSSTQTTTSTINYYQVEEQDFKLVKTDYMEMKPSFYAPARPWYQNAVKESEKPTWTVYVYRSTNAPGIDASIALTEKGEIVGVIGVGIELKQLSQYLKKLQGNREGEAFIINSKDELIASTDLEEVMPDPPEGQEVPQLKHISDASNPLLNYASQTLHNNSVRIDNIDTIKKFVYTDPNSGNEYYISLAPLGQLDWVVGTVIPEADYLVEINRNKKILLIFISAFTFTTICLAVYGADRLIARPILKVARAAADIETDKFEVDSDSLSNITKRKDELGQLARVFQNMARQIYVRENKLKQQVQELRIEIDDVKRKKQVQEIVESDFFQDLAAKAQNLRKRHHKD